MKLARLEGEAEARKALVRMIQLCEQLLHRAETPAEDLGRLSLEELSRRAEQLHLELSGPPRT